MALNKDKDLKVFYTTKEVAQMLDVNESLLRYWETVFPTIRPKTIGNGVRQYTKKNIDEIKVIYNLVKVRGFKLDAAAEMLKLNRKGVEKTNEILNRLEDVKDELTRLVNSL